MAYRTYILDVFTDTPLAGNPLAVVLDADDLDATRMQAVAAEFNLSETVFVLKPERPQHAARVRIFTPRRELPFAGHPTVGTAVLLAWLKAGAAAAGEKLEMVQVLEEAVGPVRCGTHVSGVRGGHAIFDAPRLPETVAATLDRDAVAGALGLVPAEIGFENHQPSAYSAGNPFTFVPVRGLDVIGRARPNLAVWAAAFGQAPHDVYVYCRETVHKDRAFHARMFAPELGLAEDPATGSAVAAFPGVIQQFDQPVAGSHRYQIEQGHEMKRPSLLTLEVDSDAGRPQAVRVAGDAVVVGEGTLTL